MGYLNFEGPEAFLENSEGTEGVWDLIFVKHLKNGSKLKMRAWLQLFKCLTNIKSQTPSVPSEFSRNASGPSNLR